MREGFVEGDKVCETRALRTRKRTGTLHQRHRKKKPRRETFWKIVLKILLKLHFEWKI